MSILGAVLLGAALVSQKAPPTITFRAALKAAEQHPEVRAARERSKARKLYDEGLGALATDPFLQAQPGVRFGRSDVNDGFDGSLLLQQSFSLEGWGSARRAAAEAERWFLREQIQSMLRERRRLAGTTWLAAWAERSELNLRDRLVDSARTRLIQAERSLELGAARSTEVAEARSFVAEAELARLDAEGRWFEMRVALAAACGAETPLLAPSIELPELEVFEEDGPRDVDMDPVVQSARARARATELQVEEASAQEGWQLLAGAGVAREPPGDIIPYLNLGVTLPFFGRNRRQTASRAADQAAARTTASAATRGVGRTYALAIHEVAHTRETLELLQSKLVSGRRDHAKALRRAFALGQVPLRSVLESEQALVEAEIRAARARVDHLAARFEAKMLFSFRDAEDAS
ncbi:MAG: TolC family protein [Myxococcota bacterium]